MHFPWILAVFHVWGSGKKIDIKIRSHLKGNFILIWEEKCYIVVISDRMIFCSKIDALNKVWSWIKVERFVRKLQEKKLWESDTEQVLREGQVLIGRDLKENISNRGKSRHEEMFRWKLP